MRDLKHLAYFEELLREANNALVRQACAERLPDGAFTGYVGRAKGLLRAIQGKRVA